MSSSNSKVARFAWYVLAWNILVILWGAYVRATGSGAGCGAHWPLCNGEVIPRAPGVAMLVEFSHRASSGIALVLVVALLVWVWRAFAPGHPARRGAVLATIFILTEAALGAGLVLFQLVAGNASLARALAMMVHLFNTFLLLASLALTARWADGGADISLKVRGGVLATIALALVGMFSVAKTGAMAALGDTLFPAMSFAEGLAADLSPASSLLLKLRVLHPIVAIAVAVVLVVAATTLALPPGERLGRRAKRAMVALVVAQVMAGVANIWLLAPVWLQLTHLLLADLIWIALVLLSASVLARPDAAADNLQAARPRARLA